MSLKYTLRRVGDVTIIDLAGRIVLGEGSGQIRSIMKDILAAGNNKIIVNLAEIAYVDSSGLGELISAYASVTTSGGQIKLENVQAKMADLLQITKLNTVFETFTDEAKAVRSFTASAAGA